MSTNNRQTKHSISKSSLFASPSMPKAKKFASVIVPSETVVPQSEISVAQTQTRTHVLEESEIEPMEIDETLVEQKEKTMEGVVEEENNQDDANHSANKTSCSYTTTPRKEFLPVVGRRRSILFAKEKGEVTSREDSNAVDESTAFELLISESQLEPENLSVPIKRLQNEMKELAEYNKVVINQLDQFDEALADRKARCENAKKDAGSYLKPHKLSKAYESSTIINFDELVSRRMEKQPTDILKKAYINFKKATENETNIEALQENANKAIEERDLMKYKLQLLEKVANKYRRSDAEKENAARKKAELLAEIEMLRERSREVCNLFEKLNEVPCISFL